MKERKKREISKYVKKEKCARKAKHRTAAKTDGKPK
jgi:hypothetical protein